MPLYRIDRYETNEHDPQQQLGYCDWMGGPTLSNVKGAIVALWDGTRYKKTQARRAARIIGEPDTWFSVPARASFAGKTIKGWLGCDDGVYVFHAKLKDCQEVLRARLPGVPCCRLWASGETPRALYHHPTMTRAFTPLARFGIDFLAGIGIALAVAGVVAALLQPPVPSTPAPPTPAPIVRPAPASTLTRPDLSGLRVTELRTLARQRLGSSHKINGKRIAQARKDELLQALS